MLPHGLLSHRGQQNQLLRWCCSSGKVGLACGSWSCPSCIQGTFPVLSALPPPGDKDSLPSFFHPHTLNHDVGKFICFAAICFLHSALFFMGTAPLSNSLLFSQQSCDISLAPEKGAEVAWGGERSSVNGLHGILLLQRALSSVYFRFCPRFIVKYLNSLFSFLVKNNIQIAYEY